MTETLTVTSERVDDIPILLAHMTNMDLPTLLDTHFQPHGNWRGLSVGWVSALWLTHLLSEADHRLNHVQPWAQQRLETLQESTHQAVRALDVSDDRLATVLDLLSDDARWQAFEAALNQRTLRVYDLHPQRVRLDSTTASGYWSLREEGLFQLGHSKDHRPDLPQVKVMLSALDPLGMPVATQVVSGEQADDPLYIPAIRQVRQGLQRCGLLYVGDCKMAALATRAFLQAGGDFYLCPLAKGQLPAQTLAAYLQPVWEGKQPLTAVERPHASGQPQPIAEGYELTVSLSAVVEGQPLTWQERRLVVRSLAQAQAQENALQTRLAKACAALEGLNKRQRGKKHLTTVAALREASAALVQQYRVAGLLRLRYQRVVKKRAVRRYGGRPAEVRREPEVWVRVEVDPVAVQAATQGFGWRVYVTNQPVEQLRLPQAVQAYREEFLVERGFGRLKGKPLSLRPMYLQEDQRATGLIRLLTVGLRVLCLLEFVVRRRLAEEGEPLAGLYAGNPKRATRRPTAEAMLEAFQGITLTVVGLGQQVRRHLPPLSPVQQRILALLDLPLEIYTRLGVVSLNPT
jgi:transposase